MNKIKRNGVVTRQSHHDNNSTEDSGFIREKLKDLIHGRNKNLNRKNIFQSVDENVPKLRKSVISRALIQENQKVITSTPMPSKELQKYFGTRTSMSISSIDSEEQKNEDSVRIDSNLIYTISDTEREEDLRPSKTITKEIKKENVSIASRMSGGSRLRDSSVRNESQYLRVTRNTSKRVNNNSRKDVPSKDRTLITITDKTNRDSPRTKLTESEKYERRKKETETVVNADETKDDGLLAGSKTANGVNSSRALVSERTLPRTPPKRPPRKKIGKKKKKSSVGIPLKNVNYTRNSSKVILNETNKSSVSNDLSQKEPGWHVGTVEKSRNDTLEQSVLQEEPVLAIQKTFKETATSPMRNGTLNGENVDVCSAKKSAFGGKTLVEMGTSPMEQPEADNFLLERFLKNLPANDDNPRKTVANTSTSPMELEQSEARECVSDKAMRLERLIAALSHKKPKSHKKKRNESIDDDEKVNRSRVKKALMKDPVFADKQLQTSSISTQLPSSWFRKPGDSFISDSSAFLSEKNFSQKMMGISDENDEGPLFRTVSQEEGLPTFSGSDEPFLSSDFEGKAKPWRVDEDAVPENLGRKSSVKLNFLKSVALTRTPESSPKAKKVREEREFEDSDSSEVGVFLSRNPRDFVSYGRARKSEKKSGATEYLRKSSRKRRLQSSFEVEPIEKGKVQDGSDFEPDPISDCDEDFTDGITQDKSLVKDKFKQPINSPRSEVSVRIKTPVTKKRSDSLIRKSPSKSKRDSLEPIETVSEAQRNVPEKTTDKRKISDGTGDTGYDTHSDKSKVNVEKSLETHRRRTRLSDKENPVGFVNDGPVGEAVEEITVVKEDCPVEKPKESFKKPKSRAPRTRKVKEVENVSEVSSTTESNQTGLRRSGRDRRTARHMLVGFVHMRSNRDLIAKNCILSNNTNDKVNPPEVVNNAIKNATAKGKKRTKNAKTTVEQPKEKTEKNNLAENDDGAKESKTAKNSSTVKKGRKNRQKKSKISEAKQPESVEPESEEIVEIGNDQLKVVDDNFEVKPPVFENNIDRTPIRTAEGARRDSIDFSSQRILRSGKRKLDESKANPKSSACSDMIEFTNFNSLNGESFAAGYDSYQVNGTTRMSQKDSGRSTLEIPRKTVGRVSKRKTFKKSGSVSSKLSKIVRKSLNNSHIMELTNNLETQLMSNENNDTIMFTSSNKETVSLKFVDKEGKVNPAGENLFISDFLRNGSGASMAFLEIPPGQEKPLHFARKFSIFYVVLEGEAIIIVHDKTLRITKNNIFVVPLGVQYSIKNYSKDVPLKLTFVQVPGNLTT